MNQAIRTLSAVAVLFGTVSVSVWALLDTLWMTFGWPDDATLAVGYWARPFMLCSWIAALSIGIRSWLTGEALRPAAILGGVVVVGGVTQRYGVWLNLPVTIAAILCLIALSLKMILVDFAIIGIGARPRNTIPAERMAAEPGATDNPEDAR